MFFIVKQKITYNNNTAIGEFISSDGFVTPRKFCLRDKFVTISSGHAL